MKVLEWKEEDYQLYKPKDNQQLAKPPAARLSTAQLLSVEDDLSTTAFQDRSSVVDGQSSSGSSMAGVQRKPLFTAQPLPDDHDESKLTATAFKDRPNRVDGQSSSSSLAGVKRKPLPSWLSDDKVKAEHMKKKIKSNSLFK